MTGILKQLSTSSISNIATDNYEVEAAQIALLRDQLDRAHQAAAIVGAYDLKFSNGFTMATQYERTAYQQSMESASALTYDFLPLDIGYSTEASEKTPGMLKRIWDWISKAVSALINLVRNALGLRKTKFINAKDNFEAIMAAAKHAVSDKPTQWKSAHHRPTARYVVKVGKFIGKGEVSKEIALCRSVTDSLMDNITKLVNFPPESVAAVKSKSATADLIFKKLNYKSEFKLPGGSELIVGPLTSRTDKDHGASSAYTGNVLSIGEIIELCRDGIAGAKSRIDSFSALNALLSKYDDKIKAIKKKNYDSLGDRMLDASRAKQGFAPRGIDYAKLELEANVYNALTEMIETQYQAQRDVDLAIVTYLWDLSFFLKHNVDRYKEHAE